MSHPLYNLTRRSRCTLEVTVAPSKAIEKSQYTWLRNQLKIRWITILQELGRSLKRLAQIRSPWMPKRQMNEGDVTKSLQNETNFHGGPG